MENVVLFGVGFCSLTMLIAWLVAVRMSFYSLVDVVWSYGIGTVVLLAAVLAQGANSKRILAVVLAGVWSLRLGTHLTLRLKQHFPSEDGRYSVLKKNWGKARFFVFFQFQALSQIAFCMPFFILISDPQSVFSKTTMLGILIFAMGFLGESLADQQLSRFRSKPENRHRVCDVGLWKYSRHPNYFFEWIIWCGIATSALSSPYGGLGLISPILMYLTLNYLTGIPYAEEQSLKSKGDLYKQYQAKTNRFFLGFRRN